METTKTGPVVAVTGHGYRRPITTEGYGVKSPIVHYDEHLGDAVEAAKDSAPIDFSGKDFADTQKMLNAKARADMLRNQLNDVKTEREKLANGQFRRASELTKESDIGEAIGESVKPSPDEVIQANLDRFESVKELERYLSGNVKDQKVADRINAFFTDEDGETLLLNKGGTTIKTPEQELDFKRSLLIYFKQNDEYMGKIDEEMRKMDEAVAEFNSDVSSALNPLKDNILAYVSYLEDQGTPVDGDDAAELSRKRVLRNKAKMIRSAYTLENMIELVEKRPSIVQNALNDFHKAERIKDIGERYGSKLKTAKINITLFNLLSNDVKDSVEYRMLASGEYPEGLEGFTIFFIIRSLSMSLPNKDDETFHAAVQVAFSSLLKGDLDTDVADSMKSAIRKFLSYFA